MAFRQHRESAGSCIIKFIRYGFVIPIILLLMGRNSIANDTIRTNAFEFSGFVKTDIFLDTRQMAGVRAGALVLYPKPMDLDGNGKDINARPNMNLLSIHTRLRITTPSLQIGNALVQGLIEADFLGNENASFADLNGLRLRYAYGRVVWPKTELIVGQYWHPLFFVQACPRVISINTGVPFQPLSRTPQVRITQTVGRYSIVGAVFSQQDFTSTGPDGLSSKYLRNSGLPNFHLQVQRRHNSKATFFGLAADYKVLLPEEFIVDPGTGIRTRADARLASLSLMGISHLEFNRWSLRSAAIYAQNPYDVLMIGGYAATEALNDGKRSFSNQNTASLWADLQSKGKRFLWGGFVGYTQNMGTNKPISDEQYARGANIAYVYRIAPRAQLRFDRVWCSLEVERTAVAYGDPNADGWGGVATEGEVANTRILLSFRYNF